MAAPAVALLPDALTAAPWIRCSSDVPLNHAWAHLPHSAVVLETASLFLPLFLGLGPRALLTGWCGDIADLELLLATCVKLHGQQLLLQNCLATLRQIAFY